MHEPSRQFLSLLTQNTLSNHRNLLLSCYQAAIAEGGLLEHDFIREKDSSYNPRPARIAYILHKNTGIRAPYVLAAGILASVSEKSATVFLKYQLPKEAISLACVAQQDVSELAEVSREAQCIALALRLDRARHFHLSSAVQQENKRTAFLNETQCFIDLAQNAKLPLANELAHWKKQALRWRY